jgi:hypothetical protein
MRLHFLTCLKNFLKDCARDYITEVSESEMGGGLRSNRHDYNRIIGALAKVI